MPTATAEEAHELQPRANSSANPTQDDQPSPSFTEPKRTKIAVLIGSGILQLPIWGFAMSYGVLQEYYSNNWTLSGSSSLTGIIGTTANGVMYLFMPLLFALFTLRFSHRRRTASAIGVAIACLSLFLSAYARSAWQLVVSQGVASALGCALMFSPVTLSLGEWWSSGNRAMAYGVVLSCKNLVGSCCPFILRALIDRYGYETALKAWAGIVGGTSLIGLLLIPTHPSKANPPQEQGQRSRRIPYHFLRHKSIYFYSVAIVFQSSGYGIPQTYLSTYARDVLSLSQASGTLMLTLFNAPGIVASSFFGWLSGRSDGSGRMRLSPQVVSSIPPVACALATFLFWGLTFSSSSDRSGGLALLIVFSVTFGFFSGGYSATWGGMLKQMEREAAERNEAVDAGMLYGVLNGVRGVGYAAGGFAGVGLLSGGAGTMGGSRFGYGTDYGPLIVFTGLSSLLGGWVVLWRWDLRRVMGLSRL